MTGPLPDPFRRPLRIREVQARTGLDREITATSAECAAIAAACRLPAVAWLKADLHVAARANGCFEVTGQAKALLTQVCVVTLEPFESTVSAPVDISFVLPSDAPSSASGHGLHTLEDDDDTPDVIVDNTIDLGAVALEFVMLACDPYPRKPGVEFAEVVVGDQDDPSPFAALARLKDKS